MLAGYNIWKHRKEGVFKNADTLPMQSDENMRYLKQSKEIQRMEEINLNNGQPWSIISQERSEKELRKIGEMCTIDSKVREGQINPRTREKMKK